MHALELAGPVLFLSTLSLRRATRPKWPKHQTQTHFYPRSPCGERLCECWMALNHPLFLSTLSLRRATLDARKSCDVCRISIHALLAESDLGAVAEVGCMYYISIHALLAESDRALATYWTRTVYFYPRSPCGERHYFSGVMRQNPGISIHALLAESDPAEPKRPKHRTHFYPRSPCGERHSKCRCQPAYTQISIHALLAESDASNL